MNKNELENSNIALKKIIKVSIICVFFLTSEMIGGIIANSLAIISDAAHLFSDLLGFVISILALSIGKKRANDQYTFGYYRAEVIGALISVITIWFLTILLIQEAINRLINPTEINAPVMFLTAVIGLVFNLAMIKVLHSEHGHSHGIGSCNHETKSPHNKQ
jgi:zinc transporter 2